MARKARTEMDTIEIEGCTFSAPQLKHDVPAFRPYVFRAELVRDFSIALHENLHIALAGPTGCGKTSLPSAIANRIGQSMIRLNLSGETRVTHLVGAQKPVAEDGVLTLKFSMGVVARAMREGYWLLLDEIDAAQPNVLMSLQSVLEDEPTLYLPETGETIGRGNGLHPRFFVLATGNTIGYRARQRSRHAGTAPLNTALVDRFGMVIACDYPALAEEVQIVRSVFPDIHPLVSEALCRVASEIRRDASFSSDFSTRRVLQWARLARHYPTQLLHAAELTICRKLENQEDARVFRGLASRMLGYDKGVSHV